jgi:hypothetical protein
MLLTYSGKIVASGEIHIDVATSHSKESLATGVRAGMPFRRWNPVRSSS